MTQQNSSDVKTDPAKLTMKKEYYFVPPILLYVPSGLQWMIQLNKLCRFMSTVETKPASNSEIGRWLDDGVVIVNGEPLRRNDVMNFPIHSLVMFPKSKTRRTTIF